jgi:hypothetical protein
MEKNVHLKKWISALFLCSIMLLQAQNENPILIQTIKGSFFNASNDELGNIYVVTKNKRIVKYSDKGKELGVYSNIYIDSSSYLATQNAMKTLLYSPNDGNLILLDNNMAMNSKVNLFEKGIVSPSAISLFTDNTSYWIFDINTQSLARYSATLEPVFSSKNIAQLETKKFTPNMILQNEKFVAMIDSTHGILSFDMNGNYQKLYNFKGATDILYHEFLLFMAVKDKIRVLDLRSGFQYDAKTFPNAIQIRFTYPYASVMYNDRVELYKIFN